MHIIGSPSANLFHKSILLGYILCPVHTEKTPSCAVYTTAHIDRVRLYCYGCGHLDFKDKSEVLGEIKMNSVSSQGKHPVYRPSTIASYSDAVRKFLLDRGIAPYVADRYGLRQVHHNANAVYIPAFNLKGEECGGEVRFCEAVQGRKIYRVKSLRGDAYPDHSWVLLGQKNKVPQLLYITESVLDSLSIMNRLRHGLTTVGGLAMLGTHVPTWVYPFLNDVLTDHHMVVVWFDDDPAGKAASATLTTNLHMMGIRVSEMRSGKPYRPSTQTEH